MSRIVKSFSVCLLVLAWGGCGRDARDIARLLIDAVGSIQSEAQELPQVLVDEGDTIIINQNVTIIDDVEEDLIYEELPNQTILGFENNTGWDIYIQYLADGEPQAVYVYDGEALLLEYPCLESVELISEDDIDPATEELVETFDLSGTVFTNPEDFFCGDAFILVFEPDAITATAEVVDLVL